MNFFALLFLALGALWLQALVIQLSALNALREDLRARWESLLGLQRVCVRRILDASCDGLRGSPVVGEDLWERLQGCLLPEDIAALAVLEEAERMVDKSLPGLSAAFKEEALRLGLFAQWDAVFVRARNARDAFEEAVKAYEGRRMALRMEGVVAWFGYKPHSTVGRTPKVR